MTSEHYVDQMDNEINAAKRMGNTELVEILKDRVRRMLDEQE